MANITVNVQVITRATTNSALTYTTSSSVTIAAGLGDSASRQAIATAISANDTGSAATKAIKYNGYDIPITDYPKGHTF